MERIVCPEPSARAQLGLGSIRNGRGSDRGGACTA